MKERRGPSRFNNEVDENAFSPSSSLPDDALKLKTKIAELEKQLEHSRAVAAAAKPHSALDLDRVAILGERNTGTNPVEHILRTNLRTGEIAIQAGLRNIKHYFQEPDNSVSTTLVLIIVRNPYDWVDSMHRSCYCCEDVHTKTLEEFLKMPFGTTPIDPVTGQSRPTEGCPMDTNIYARPTSSSFSFSSSSSLQQQKGGTTIVTNNKTRGFKNIMSARYEKFHHWINFTRTAGGYEIVQIETLLEPEKQKEWFMKLAEKWHLPISLKTDGFEPLVKDARFWRVKGEETYFSLEKRIANSIYLDKEQSEKLLMTSASERRSCRLKNLYFDDFVEEMMGYHRVNCEVKKKEQGNSSVDTN